MPRDIADPIQQHGFQEASPWLRWLETERGASPHTLDNYGRDLRRFLLFLGIHGYHQLVGVSSDMVRAFIAAEFGQGRSQRSVARELSTLRSLFKFLARDGAVSVAVVGPVKPSAPPPSRSVPTDSALDRVIAAAARHADMTWVGHRDHALFLLMLDCGLSLGEALALRHRDVPFAVAPTMTVGKGARMRTVNASRRVIDALHAYLEGCPIALAADTSLFRGIKGGPLNPGVVQRRFRNLRSTAGLPEDATPHALRKGFLRASTTVTA
ncbi:MAG TPA: site-specific integrase [Magnetospirillum sp.]|nr:site-specific integrase [Magnetospirillum sp.]